MSSSSSSSIQPFSVPPPPNDMNPFAAASLPAAAATAAFAASSASLVAAASSSGGHQWWKYLLILIILGFLMLMLFVYFARKYIPDLSLIFDLLGVFGATAAAANPTKKTAASAATAAAGTVQPKTADTQTSSTVFKKQDESAAEHQELVEKPNRGKVAAVPEPMPDDAGSRTQASKASSKAGFCYIGEDRGFRSCIQVKESDTCMSGDIFPTEAICINPNLRE